MLLAGQRLMDHQQPFEPLVENDLSLAESQSKDRSRDLNFLFFKQNLHSLEQTFVLKEFLKTFFSLAQELLSSLGQSWLNIFLLNTVEQCWTWLTNHLSSYITNPKLNNHPHPSLINMVLNILPSWSTGFTPSPCDWAGVHLYHRRAAGNICVWVTRWYRLVGSPRLRVSLSIASKQLNTALVSLVSLGLSFAKLIN